MVCPNCHSDQIIMVQDQHFCINCGQMVPEEVASTPAKEAPAEQKPVAQVQSNGLPAGVKLLPLSPTEPAPVVANDSSESSVTLVHSRSRIDANTDTDTDTSAPAKKRKPGRPKAGRLDVPRIFAKTDNANTPSLQEISVPNLSASASPIPSPAPLPSAPPVPVRRMSDLAPRRAVSPAIGHSGKAATLKKAAVEDAKGINASLAHQHSSKTSPSEKPENVETKGRKSGKKRAPARAHHVGVPPLHYAPVVAFSLRARFHPRLVGLAALGTLALGMAVGYGVWSLLGDGARELADNLLHSGPRLLIEIILLGAMYYIGRSLGQTAIIYGIAREADQRPVTLSRQFGVAVNTFGRRLRMDMGFGLAQVSLLAAAAALFITGGTRWPLDTNLQIGMLFMAYLTILYLLSALTLSRGLAGVNLTLTNHRPFTAARFGWQLFSHRIELIGPRLGAILLEWLLALPLIVLIVALVVAAPPDFRIWVAIGAGIIAWLAGALMGVGTAAWWTMLYRQLIMADHPANAIEHLSSRQPEDARRLPLVLIVALSTLVIAATLTLPWLQLT